MPLNTEIQRMNSDGELETLPLRWDYTILSCMMTAACMESIPDKEWDEGRTWRDLEGQGKFVDFSMAPIYYMNIPLIRRGKHVLKRDHTFVINNDGTTLELKKGDILRAWRSYK